MERYGEYMADTRHPMRVFVSWAMTLGMVGLLAWGGWWVFLSGEFNVENVELSGNAFLTDAQVGALLEPYHIQGKHMWFIGFDSIASDLMDNPRIASATFHTEYPNLVKLVISEAVEFGTVELASGERAVVDENGKFIRTLALNDPPVGPIFKGFTGDVLQEKPPATDLDTQTEIWSGLSSEPSKAGKLQPDAPFDPKGVGREMTRYADALRLAELTWVESGPAVSGYDYIGIDGNYDIFISYPDMPPIVLGGLGEPYSALAEVKSLLKLDENSILRKYDYIDMHVPDYTRGIIVADMEKFPGREWSGGKEAMNVAIWKMAAEIESRSGA
jgi:hypothetical protein